MDPFNMPAFGTGPTYSDLQTTVKNVAPLATEWHGAQTGVPIQQIFNKPAYTPPPSNVSKFVHFIGGVASEIGHITAGAATWLATNTAHMAVAPVHYAAGLRNAFFDNYDIDQLNAQTKQQSDALQTLHDRFKAGRLTMSQYQGGLKELIRENNVLTQQHISLDNRISSDQKNAYKATIDTASLLVTVLTAGFGKAASTLVTADGLVPVAETKAAGYLSSVNANAYLSGVEQGIKRVASDPELFAQLTPAAQRTLQTAVAEVIASNTGTMTAGQIARASAVNLALKYPIYYNMLSSQGQEIYAKLDNKEYGSAVQQTAFNAILLLAGGPIGQSLKYGGKVLGGIGSRTFARTSFLDELSKGIGDGNPAGLYRAIAAIKDPQLRQEAIQGLSAVEATNMAAVTGKDPVAAAWRVLNGMSAYEGVTMKEFTHEEALNNMVNFATAQRLADEAAKAAGLGPVTVGRIDARQLNEISLALSGIEGKEARLSAWEDMKSTSQNYAWAHNENFDRQIKNLIDSHPEPGQLDAAIRGIKASFSVKGFPEAVAKKLSKMGYIPIKPANLEAPYKEGAGKLVSKFAGKGDDFFLKAVEPLPFLSSVGSFLTHLGLSPQASTSRVYQLFNSNLSERLSKMELMGRVVDKGASDRDTADNLIKILSNYAHNPTRGIHVNGQPLAPITDLRQLTTKDIMAALNTSKSDAKAVKGAILDAMLAVPLQVRGLGDKLVDLSYSLVPTTGKYLKIQGAARFAWNPFFQGKLAVKTELLSQLEAQGKFPTMGGMNTILSTIFPDKYAKIDEVRGMLRKAGVFDEKAAQLGEGMSGEAVNDVGVAGANLTHKLIPSQERSIASLIQVQADRLGMSTEDFIANFPNDVRDTVQTIAQYDRNSEFLNSAMARTLNLAFFPFRFEYKVASITARSLAKTSPMTQLAVINGLYRAHDWLNSAEGQVWYSQNADVIGIIKYFTPIQTLGEVATLLGGHPDSIGAFGELGGLPFGWIPQLLDAEGLTNFGGAYVNPKTGETVPDYIPVTDKGRLAAAIQDLISSIFTYPGATLGLPSKTNLTRNIAMGVTGASKDMDFTKVNPPLTDKQQQFSDNIQSAANQTLQSNIPVQQPMPNPNAAALRTPLNVPRQASPLTTPIPRTTKTKTTAPANTKPGTGKKGRVKKSSFRPYLLPGQTSLGQVPGK